MIKSTIGITILNYNDYSRTIKLAKKVASFQKIDEVVIVDNYSNEKNKQELMALHYPKIDVIFSNKNNGFAAGNNVGLRQLVSDGCKYVFAINSDVIAEENVFNECIKTMQNHSDIAVLSPLMRDYKTKKIDYRVAWNYPSYHQALQYCFWIGRRFNYNNYVINKQSINQSLIYSDCVRGSFQCFRSDILKKANFYDEGTFLYNEENILSKRIHKVSPTSKEAIITTIYYQHNQADNTKINTNRFKWSLNSQHYYFKKYCTLTKGKSLLLKICENLGILEHYLIDLVINIK